MSEKKNGGAPAAAEGWKPVEESHPAAPASPPRSALLEQVEDRGYTSGNAVADPALLASPLPQATISPQNAGREEDIFSTDIKKQREKTGEQKGAPGAGDS